MCHVSEVERIRKTPLKQGPAPDLCFKISGSSVASFVGRIRWYRVDGSGDSSRSTITSRRKWRRYQVLRRLGIVTSFSAPWFLGRIRHQVLR